MNGRMRCAGFAPAVLALTAIALLAGAFAAAPAHADGGRDRDAQARARRGSAADVIVQHAVLRWRDGWPYGGTEAGSAHVRGSLAAGAVTLTRRASGIRLEVQDRDTAKHHAYSIWFQVCPEDSVFTDGDTQCSLPKQLNMNGSGGVAGPHGLHVTFELATGTPIASANVCGFDPAYLTSPCPAWGSPGILVGDVVFSERMALHGPVRIVVKDHGPTKHIKELGKALGMKAQAALFTALHRTDGPECQPARPVCPDAHVAVFAAPATGTALSSGEAGGPPATGRGEDELGTDRRERGRDRDAGGPAPGGRDDAGDGS